MTRENLMALTLPLIALMSVLTACLGLYLRRNVFNPEGKGSERETRRILRRYALLRGCKVLENLRLTCGSGAICAQTVLLGPFGLLLVHTCGARGEYYGQPDEPSWVLVRGTQRIPFPNPLLEQREAMRLIREVLAAEGIYKVPMEQVVYCNNPARKSAVYLADRQVVERGGLQGFLESTRFDREAGFDAQRVFALLSPLGDRAR